MSYPNSLKVVRQTRTGKGNALGSRVLRTILAEHRRAARLRRLERADVVVHRPRFLRPRNELIVEAIEDFMGAIELAEESAS